MRARPIRPRRRHRAATPRALAILVALGAPSLGCSCTPVPPPRSPMPNAQAAIDRMRATAACGIGVGATEAKIDHLGDHGRIRAEMNFYAFLPARLRLDVQGPLNSGIVATLTSDGKHFALADMRQKRFLYGPASACNIARLTTVPIPGHALVSLLRGQAPVLKHDPNAGTIRWDGGGYYVVTIPSTNQASEEIHLAPHPDDFGRDWREQRMRVLEVLVRQQGIVLYDAELKDHRAAPMGEAIEDPTGLEPATPPSGPVCTADLPRSIHVDAQDQEVIFNYDKVTWNPALPLGDQGTFTQEPPPGLDVVRVDCE